MDFSSVVVRESSSRFIGRVFLSNPREMAEFFGFTEDEALKTYIRLNYDGLKDFVIKMLGGGKVQINTGTFSNDMATFQGKDDELTLLVHLGYLSYHWPDKTVYIPNKEVSQEYLGGVWHRNCKCMN